MNKVRTYGLLTIGGLMQGLAMAVFLFPHAIPSGGAAAIAVLMQYLLAIPFEYTLWVVNFGLLSVAMKWLGYTSAIRTMYAVSVASVTINLSSVHFHWPFVYLWLDLLWGSLLFGLGVGLLLRQGATNGGMVILALIISIYKGYAPGKVMFWINATIFLITAVVIEWSIIVLALLCQWLSTRIIDLIYKADLVSCLLAFFTALAWRRR
ncbi:protein of unknown function DUF161 [Caldalkalibacillus thermarum TA2.A1]|uniref:YitT family protein n=1 Tax=Caldalkalibacillus thermarum (strain TA2.A1) TaxID=986075 RepID=F5L687_CALTT|nr:YitT family protein [Caldalkalibacillus thermarum]EGL83137.1 protein of unknown function DUF161 [Caldalkalibacillus thermarum TA2.A1]QZT34835.1 YitT family protein [Caldalkalibacillus thermarum TA2.A1]